MFRNLYVLAPEGAPAAGAAPAATTTTPTSSSTPASGASNAQNGAQNAQKPGENTPSGASKGAATAGEKTEGKPAPKPDELFEIKSAGKTKKVTREQLLKLAELGDGAQERFQEAAQLKKQAEGLLARMRDPKQAIALLQDPKLGLDPQQVREAFEEWYVHTHIRREKMSPEQRELEDAKEKLKQHEEEKKAEQEARQKEADAKMDAETRQALQKELIDTLETSSLPKTRFTVARLAYWNRVNHEQGINAPREMIVAQVQKEMRNIMDSMVQSSDGDVLANLLGEATVKKLRKYDLERLRAKRAGLSGTTPPAPKKTSEQQPRRKLRSADVNRNLRNLRLGKW